MQMQPNLQGSSGETVTDDCCAHDKKPGEVSGKGEVGRQRKKRCNGGEPVDIPW
jgi:hypothetical protein